MKFTLTFCCLTFFRFFSTAQLCNNNLGDPVVNINFGIKGASAAPSKTDYSRTGGCPSKGEYTINDFLFGCGGSWVAMTGDNTPGDLNGNYMLINAESMAGIVVQDTAKNLCENMTYQFSAYITNVLQTNLSCGSSVVLPNLDFTIESLAGAVLATYNTGDIPITDIKQWKQFGFSYKTTAGINAVVLKITANSEPGCGNAFAIDDIIFQNCGPAVNITIDGITQDQRVCADYTNPFILQGTYDAGFINPVVQWQSSFDSGKTWKDIPSATTTTYKVPHRTSGRISYRMVVAEKENISSVNCRMRSNSILTEINPVPPHQPTKFISGCTGKDYSLPKGDDKAIDFIWSGPNGYSSTDRNAVIFNLQFADTGLYTLKQTYDFGCTDFDSVYLEVSPGVVLSALPAKPICEGESETLSVTASGNIGSFKWIPSAGLSSDDILNPVAAPADSTVYKLIATNTYGCQDSILVPVDVYHRSVANAGPDKIFLNGDTAVLDGFVRGTLVNFYWSPPMFINDVNVMRPKVYPLQDMTYTLTAVSTVGCGQSTDDVNVQVFKGLFIPNSFTPNGDGKNDRFRIVPFDNYKVIRFVIYNRWGSVIFNSTDIGSGWDGNYKSLPQPIGSYIFYLELQGTNGEKITKRGTVNLLR